ncbi:MAG: transketolase [candidate division WOR-3 bacterium]|nr:MAG: transketolase [candidate division WOR-3 bacterium]
MKTIENIKETINHLQELSRLCRGDIIKMTTVAGSGHPAGSLSSIDLFLTVYTIANLTPASVDEPARDRVIVSHGHTSPGVYACLARLGYCDIRDVLTGFRRSDSPYEGHVERHIPGIEWTTGNLGQGLSAGCGCALASRVGKHKFNTFVIMSDAEQAKGQVAEARRFARKYDLHNLTVVIDKNNFQISGRTDDVMPVNIRDNYLADGWKVLEVSGHDFRALISTLTTALHDVRHPYAIIAHTVMGRGVSFMENRADYHGMAATRDECRIALAELDIEDDVDELTKQRSKRKYAMPERDRTAVPTLKTGRPKIYTDTTHPRAAFGNALAEIARLNPNGSIVVFDCDLADSVRVSPFLKVRPDCFFEAGVSEHTTATIAGMLSISGPIVIWADFGVFSIDEVYNQLRLNDINHVNLKIVATHLGYNVGPDGKTHHCIDYIGLLRNLPGYRLLIPADPNQADHMTRFFINQAGNHVLALTRTKLPPLTKESGEVMYGKDYSYSYGAADVVRKGSDCAVLTMGSMVHMAVHAHDQLKQKGVRARIYNVTAPLHLDPGIIKKAAKTGLIITYEDHIVTSGLGNVVAQIIGEQNLSVKIVKMGIQQYGGSDQHEILYEKHGLDTGSLVEVIIKNLKKVK